MISHLKKTVTALVALFSFNDKGNQQLLPFGCTQKKTPLLCNCSQTTQERYPTLGKPDAMSSTQKANPLLSLARGFKLETSNMEVPCPNHWATLKDTTLAFAQLNSSALELFQHHIMY